MASYFEWNVNQEIVHFIGPFGLRWYSLFFLGGILLGYHIFGRFLEKEGRPIQLRDPLLYYIVIGTVLGARLGHCLFYDPLYYFSQPLRILRVWEGGLASHGGFAGVMLGLICFSRKYKETAFFWLADRIAIVAVLAGAFIRLGNFFNSEIIGQVTSVPWAVIFAKVDHLPRHPTQLYEALGYACISLCLYLIYRSAKRQPLEGRLYGCAMLLGYSFRFVIETLKENQVSYEQGMWLNMGQLLSLPFVLFGFYLVFGLQHRLPGFKWALSPSVKKTPKLSKA